MKLFFFLWKKILFFADSVDTDEMSKKRFLIKVILQCRWELNEPSPNHP